MRDETDPRLVANNQSTASFTSDVIDLGLYPHMRVLSHSADSFNGLVVVEGLLSGENREGAIVDSGTAYKQFGAPHTVNACEIYRNVPRKVRISYTGRTTGALTLWIQGFSD